MTITEFRALGRDVPDLNIYGCTPDADEPSPGRLYPCNTYIQRVDHKKGRWLLVLGNQDWLTNDLTDLEVRLYDWAIGECDLDAWLEANPKGVQP